MIQVTLPAYMWCEEKDCKAQQPAVLFLTAMGGFSFRPSSDTWQVMMRNDGSGPILCRCPLHKTPEGLVKPVSVLESRGGH
jgi:hypothetical protein